MSNAKTPLNAYDLRVFWSKKERDIVYDGPCGPDRHLMHVILTAKRRHTDGFDPSLQEELILRGYDITTLKISVRRFSHPWIVSGREVWHRRTKELRRVHHVRYEAGAAFVLLVAPTQKGARVEMPRDAHSFGSGYITLAQAEEEYTPERPVDLREILAAEGAGL